MGAEPGAIEAYTLGADARQVAPLPVDGVSLQPLMPGHEGALARAMEVEDAEVHRRLAKGARASVALLGDRSIAGYGWVSHDAARIYELGIHVRLPHGHAYIWDCLTLPAYRGRGIFPALLRFIVEQQRIAGIRQVWAGVAPENDASLRSFARAGFRLVAHTYLDDGQCEVHPTHEATPREVRLLARLNARL